MQGSLKGSSPLRIGIVGAGFSGTAVAAALHKLAPQPIDICLFDKTGSFGTGDAYRTPYSFHLLNVRARDMSAFEDQPQHFVDWLHEEQSVHAYLAKNIPFGEQFLPRFLYSEYLKKILNDIHVSQKVRMHMEPSEVIDVLENNNQAQLILQNGKAFQVDKVVLALGNPPPAKFPFPVSADTQCIVNPWDYTAVKKIDKKESVLIVGTGLSMIDAVLTLHQQHHQGKIIAVSRHGLLPLPHSDTSVKYTVEAHNIPYELRALTKHLRAKSKRYIEEGGDWRSVINAMRDYLPKIWEQTSLPDKKRFLRHVMPYWNIHRHRVNNKVAELFAELSSSGQLSILAGRILEVENGQAAILLRQSKEISKINADWLINCMGPALNAGSTEQPLVNSLLKRGAVCLDPLQLGLVIDSAGALQSETGQASSLLYALGPPVKGAFWECTAVPEIRKHSLHLAKNLLGI